MFRVVALPAPTEREQSQMYVERYVAHFPAAGEVVIFDRSWNKRAGVGDHKMRGRLNITSHLLSQVRYEPLPHRDVTLPKRRASGYVEAPLCETAAVLNYVTP